MNRKKFIGLFLMTAAVSGCMGVDSKYSDGRHGAKFGYPELALELGRVKKDCVLQPSDWEPVFIKNKISTARRVSNALNGMQQNGQIIYFGDKRVVAVTAEYCDK